MSWTDTKMFTYGRWQAWALLVLLPLLLVPSSTDPYSSIRWVAMAVVCCVALLGNLKHWQASIAVVDPWVRGAMAVFGLGGLVSCLFALHPVEALWDATRWLMVMGLIVSLAWGMRQNPLLLRSLWRAASTAALLLGALRGAQAAGWIGGLPTGGDLAAATMGNPNFFDGAMVILLGLTLGGILQDRGLWRAVAITAAGIAIFWTLKGSSSGALLALTGMGAVLLEGAVVMQWPRMWYARTRWTRLTLVLLGLTAALLAFGYALSLNTDGMVLGSESTLERVVIWKTTIKMIAQAPIVGVGPGQWHYHILRLGQVSNYQGFATRYYIEAHNDYLQMLAERGVVGGLAFMVLLGGCWASGWRRVGNGSRDCAALGAQVALTGWMAFAATNLPGEQAYLTLLLIVPAAILLGPASTDTNAIHDPQAAAKAPTASAWSRFKTPLQWVFMAVMALSAFITLAIHAAWLPCEIANYKVMEAKDLQDFSNVTRYAKAAERWYNPNDRVSGTPLSWYQGIGLLHQGRAQAALPFMLAAKAQHPWHPQVSSNLGAAYFMVGDHEAATRELEDLVLRFPDFGEARMNLTEIYMTTGKLNEAAATIDYWRTRTSNPQFNDYYAKISGILKANQVAPHH